MNNKILKFALELITPISIIVCLMYYLPLFILHPEIYDLFYFPYWNYTILLVIIIYLPFHSAYLLSKHNLINKYTKDDLIGYRNLGNVLIIASLFTNIAVPTYLFINDEKIVSFNLSFGNGLNSYKWEDVEAVEQLYHLDRRYVGKGPSYYIKKEYLLVMKDGEKINIWGDMDNTKHLKEINKIHTYVKKRKIPVIKFLINTEDLKKEYGKDIEQYKIVKEILEIN